SPESSVARIFDRANHTGCGRNARAGTIDSIGNRPSPFVYRLFRLGIFAGRISGSAWDKGFRSRSEAKHFFADSHLVLAADRPVSALVFSVLRFPAEDQSV